MNTSQWQRCKFMKTKARKHTAKCSDGKNKGTHPTVAEILYLEEEEEEEVLPGRVHHRGEELNLNHHFIFISFKV